MLMFAIYVHQISTYEEQMEHKVQEHDSTKKKKFNPILEVRSSQPKNKKKKRNLYLHTKLVRTKKMLEQQNKQKHDSPKKRLKFKSILEARYSQPKNKKIGGGEWRRWAWRGG